MNKINLFFLLCVLGIFSACYDDKGNYDYKDKLEITISNIENKQAFVQEVIEFRPQVSPEDRTYDYLWELMPSTETILNFDTISMEKDFDFTVNLRPGNYRLRLRARDVETGIFTLQEYSLSVVMDMAVGWWFLKENEGTTDIDLQTADQKKENLLATQGYRMEGEPKNFAYVGEWDYTNDETNEVEYDTKAVFVVSDKDVVAIDFYSGNVLKNFEGLFIDVPTNKKPQNIFQGNQSLFLVNDNHIHLMLLLGNGETGFFADEYAEEKPIVISDYRVASSEIMRPLLFDELSSSFISTSRDEMGIRSLKNDGWDEGSDQSAVNNLNADLLYAGARLSNTSTSVNMYALMKSRTMEEFRLLKMRSSVASSYNNPVLKTFVLDASMNITTANRWTMAKNYDLMYFAKGNELWSMDVANFNEVKQDVTVPAGEKITYMENLNYRFGDQANWFDAVIIATVNGNHYKVYRYNIQAGKLQYPTVVGEGTGRVVRCTYLNNGNETMLL